MVLGQPKCNLGVKDASATAFQPRNILITGGAGFIASHVVLRLVNRYPQYKVVVLDKLDYCASLKNLSSIEGKPNYKVLAIDVTPTGAVHCPTGTNLKLKDYILQLYDFVKGDIQSSDLVNYLLKGENIDTVMHFAAQTHVDHSFGNSLAFTMNNTYGTHVLLECSRVAGTIKRFINVSTDEVYGETSLGKDKGLGEHSSLEPTNPYSAAKAGAEMMCKAYMNSYKMPIIVTRGNNVYGPHQFPEKLIPKFTLLGSQGRELPIHGDGMNIRSYLYVEDVAEAYDIILHKGVTGDTYNIGTQIERSVLDVCEDISQHFKLPSTKIKYVKDRAFNDRRYFIGCDKLAGLGWKERTSWEEGLQKTIDWYLEHGFEYWDKANVEAALEPHPLFHPTSNGGLSSGLGS